MQTIEECALIDPAWLDDQTDKFVIVGDGGLLDYNGTAQTVTIPAGVKTIFSAFYENKTMTAVQIPEGVTAIGTEAFTDCRNLTRIILPDSMKVIGDGAFAAWKICCRART